MHPEVPNVLKADVQTQAGAELPPFHPAKYHGFISVAPGHRYFQDEDGQGFIVIGENDAISWPGLATLMGRVSADSTERYVMDLRAHGVTVSRVMIEYAQYSSTYLENPVGTFTPAVVQFWDDFIPMAEKHGLYLLLTPYDTFWQAKNWDSYPYNAALGGPCQTKNDWLTAPACIAAQKARWAFIIKRWGGAPNIFAWDLMNEIDIWWNASPREINDYLTNMAAYVRGLERATWGRTHLLTASAAAPVPGTALGRPIYNHPDLDFANTHLYVGPGVRAPRDVIEAAPEIIGAVNLSLQAIHTPRPYLDTETGPIDHWIVNADFDKQYHHNISWAHLASCGAGSGMRWPYTTPHWLLPELRQNLLGLARFAATLDWAHFAPHNLVANISLSAPGIIKTGCGSSDTAVLWLLRDTRLSTAPNLSGLTVELTNTLAEGTYQVELWETYEGRKFNELTAAAKGGSLSFTLPTLDVPLNDLAILIRQVF